VTIPAAALLPSPSGDCLPMADLSNHLPLTLTHDAVSQRLLLEATAALPVLMRLAREERQARLWPETLRPAYPLLERPRSLARLWSADLAAGMLDAPQGRQLTGSLLASGELFGLAGRLSLALSGEGRLVPGFALTDARDTPDLLGPLGARSLALGDVAAPGQPLIGETLAGEPAGPTAFATVGWGVTPRLTARADLRAALDGAPALGLGLSGAHGGMLWTVSGARDRLGGLGGALRIARRIGAQDITFDLARHGRDDGPGLPPLVREFRSVASLAGQGRIGLGRLSLPWQARVQSGTLRRGDARHVVAARLIQPMADWQASLALGGVREGGAPWQGTAALGVTARHGSWRLRSGITAADREGWRIEGASISAARNLGQGAIALDLDWQADSGRLGGGLTFSQQLGALGLSAGIGREEQGWRFGIGLTMGLWRGPQRWRTAPSGIARSGAIMAEMFVDEDGDGVRGAGEAGVEGGRLIVGAALRRETTDAQGTVLIRRIAPGPDVDVETQLSSLDDFTLCPARAGDRLALRPGEVRHVPVALRPTGASRCRRCWSRGIARPRARACR
jgi:hypothetical protein